MTNKIIVFNNFDKLAIYGEIVHFERGKELCTITQNNQEYVCDNNNLITKKGSQNYIQHFALNNDGQGLLRGDITFFLSNYDHYTDEQMTTLRTKWAEYLMDYSDTILFNDNFYDADINVLNTILDSLGLEVNNNVSSTGK